MSDTEPQTITGDEVGELPTEAAPTPPTEEGVPEKPLRLNRRADGSLMLRGLDGNAAEFPPVFTFNTGWMFTTGAENVRMEDGQIVLTLANAGARYDIVEEKFGGTAFLCEIVADSVVFQEPVPVDEDKAAERRDAARYQAIRDLATSADITPDIAERILVAQGAIEPNQEA